jgi:hypothetical protein
MDLAIVSVVLENSKEKFDARKAKKYEPTMLSMFLVAYVETYSLQWTLCVRVCGSRK